MTEPTMSIALSQYAFLYQNKKPASITELQLHPTRLTIVIRMNGRDPQDNPLADLILTPNDARALGQALLALAGEQA